MWEDKLFRPGEAEALTRTARQHLQTADDLRQQGRETCAQREEATANRILDELVTRLRPRFARYAIGYFRSVPDRREILLEASQQMALELIRRLKHPTQGELFERKFNKALTYPLQDAVKKVRRNNGMDEHGVPKGGELPTSWEQGFQRAEAEGVGFAPADRVPDQAASHALSCVDDCVTREQLLAKVPNPAHAQALRGYQDGWTIKQIAANAGISERTATRYIKQAFEFVYNLEMAEPTAE